MVMPASVAGNAPWMQIPSFPSLRIIAGPGPQHVPVFTNLHTNPNYGGHTNTSYGGGFMPPHIPGPIFTSSAQVPPFKPTTSMSAAVEATNPMQLSDGAHPTAMDKIDVTNLILNLRKLITQANQAVGDILNLLKVKHSSLPRKGLDPAVVDNSGQGLKVAVCKTISGNPTDTKVALEGAERSDDLLKVRTLLNDMLKNLKDQGDLSNDFFYKDAPGVVQVPVHMNVARDDGFMLPGFAMGETWLELVPWKRSEGDNAQVQGSLLPSRFWLLKKEIDMWKDLPLKCTLTQLETVVALARLKRADLKRWLLTHLPSYGVVPDRALADHIVVLLVFCLRAAHREATTTTSRMSTSAYGHNESSFDVDSHGKNYAESQEKTDASVLQMIECRVLSDSACWLSSQLSLLCDAAASKNLVLGLYKHALEGAAYCLAFSQTGANCDSDGGSPRVDSPTAGRTSPEEKTDNLDCSPFEINSDRSNEALLVGEGVLSLQRLAAAVLAVQERVALKKHRNIDSHFFHATPSQRSALHSTVVKRAEEVRAARANYRAVLEHDGLIWQRQQNQEFKKNKTKEEILAEERDYKRRRMSYRGKKVKRTPAQVLRDIIEGHMEEIVAAGGIGSFGRKPQDFPFSQSETEPSEIGTKDCTDTAQGMRHSSREAQDRESGIPQLDYSRYSRSGSRGEYFDGKCRGDRHGSVSASLSTSSRSHHDRDKGDSHYLQRHDNRRPYNDNPSESPFDRKYESGRKYSRWENKLQEGEGHKRSHGDERHYSSRTHE